MYEELNGLSMGGLISSVLANIITTESGKVIVGKLTEDIVLRFCKIYIDDTLPVIKRSGIAFSLNKFNSFDSNLSRSNIFEKCVAHFLDI